MKNIISVIVYILIVLTIFTCVSCEKEQPLPVETESSTAPRPIEFKEATCMEFTVSSAFSSNMVLQRDEYVRIWGWSEEEGAVVNAEINGVSGSGVVADGEWTVILPKLETNKNSGTLRIYGKEKEVLFTDVLVGDVWMAIGQSNMEVAMDVKLSTNPEAVAQAQESDNIRFVVQAKADIQNDKVGPDNLTQPLEDVINPKKSAWRKSNKKNLTGMSCVGYYFAKELIDKTNNDIPMGIVMAAASGSALFEFIPTPLAKELGHPNQNELNMENAENMAGWCYNGLIAPYQKMAIKGIIFYQGESDCIYNIDHYESDFYRFVDELRDKFNLLKHDFPFYITEIVPMPVGKWVNVGVIRAIQTDTAKNVKNAGIISTLDLYAREKDEDWLHPWMKKEVGERLAWLALANDYGVMDKEEALSPVPVSIKKEKKNSVVITFEHVGGGLAAEGHTEYVTGFKVWDGTAEYPADTAEIISENQIRITYTSAFESVRYSYGDNDVFPAVANLKSGSGLPCVSFEMKVK